MLALSDASGHVCASIGGLAHAARVNKEDCEKALSELAAPDEDSRSAEFEGRRIEKVEGGWRILNYTKYRELGKHIDRAEYLALKQRESRKRRQQTSTGVNKPSTLPSASISASSSLFKEDINISNNNGSNNTVGKCTQKEAEEYCLSLGLTRSDGEAMFLHFEERGWAKTKNWKLTIRKWQLYGYLPSQKNGTANRPKIKMLN